MQQGNDSPVHAEYFQREKVSDNINQ